MRANLPHSIVLALIVAMNAFIFFAVEEMQPRLILAAPSLLAYVIALSCVPKINHISGWLALSGSLVCLVPIAFGYSPIPAYEPASVSLVFVAGTFSALATVYSATFDQRVKERVDERKVTEAQEPAPEPSPASQAVANAKMRFTAYKAEQGAATTVS